MRHLPSSPLGHHRLLPVACLWASTLLLGGQASVGAAAPLAPVGLADAPTMAVPVSAAVPVTHAMLATHAVPDAAGAPSALVPPPPPHAAAAPPGPWRLAAALGLPAWLQLGIEQRSRWERLGDDFRVAASGDAMAVSLRTLAALEVASAHVTALVELADARAYANAATQLANTVVNPLDVLQAQVTLRGDGVLRAGDKARLSAGRMTIDLGSRRLLARNEFRNTINSFVGVDGQWTDASGWTARVLAVAPVLRRPVAAVDLAANRLQADEAQAAAWLGVAWLSGPVPWGAQLELFVVGLHESDSPAAATADRRLLTPTVRWVRAPASGRFDGQFEASVQFGRSRASSKPTDAEDLRHAAAAVHAQLGYRSSLWGQLRLAALFDYGSGDADPRDGSNGQFDTLFAARRFDFGPTGLYGALARSNLVSPGLRAEFAPGAVADATLSWHAAWLDAARDAWVPAGLRDPQGLSGRAIGHQLDIRLRWHIWPRNLSLDVGGAVLWRQGMAAALGADRGDPLYSYAQLTGVL